MKSTIISYVIFIAVLAMSFLIIPTVSAKTLNIPKLSYTPTTMQLLSDFNLQEQMLGVNLQVSSNAPVAGYAGFGIDSKQLNVILALTSATQPLPETGQIAIDGKPGGIPGFDTDDFILFLEWDTTKDTKQLMIQYGTTAGSVTDVAPAPKDFGWDANFTTSHFDEQSKRIIMVAQIPFSRMGNGTQGQYGIMVAMQYGPPYAATSPSYPAEGTMVIPSTYAIFSTVVPIPEFTTIIGPAIGAVLFLVTICMSYSRRRVTRSLLAEKLRNSVFHDS